MTVTLVDAAGHDLHEDDVADRWTLYRLARRLARRALAHGRYRCRVLHRHVADRLVPARGADAQARSGSEPVARAPLGFTVRHHAAPHSAAAEPPHAAASVDDAAPSRGIRTQRALTH